MADVTSGLGPEEHIPLESQFGTPVFGECERRESSWPEDKGFLLALHFWPHVHLRLGALDCAIAPQDMNDDLIGPALRTQDGLTQAPGV